MKGVVQIISMVLFFFSGYFFGKQKEQDRKNTVYDNVHRVLEDATLKGRDSVLVRTVWDTMFVKSEF